jgi:hypothetical protein
LAQCSPEPARRLKPAALSEPTSAVRAVGFSPRASQHHRVTSFQPRRERSQ